MAPSESSQSPDCQTSPVTFSLNTHEHLRSTTSSSHARKRFIPNASCTRLPNLFLSFIAVLAYLTNKSSSTKIEALGGREFSLLEVLSVADGRPVHSIESNRPNMGYATLPHVIVIVDNLYHSGMSSHPVWQYGITCDVPTRTPRRSYQVKPFS
jgi:hypothetical protein